MKPRAITIHNLAAATAQEVFDHIAWHLLTQQAKSATGNSDSCFYRLGELSCAAGCLIPDEDYAGLSTEDHFDNGTHGIEGYRWSCLISHSLVPTEHQQLIENLQRCHDDLPVTFWPSKLEVIAVYSDLSTSILKAFK